MRALLSGFPQGLLACCDMSDVSAIASAQSLHKAEDHLAWQRGRRLLCNYRGAKSRYGLEIPVLQSWLAMNACVDSDWLGSDCKSILHGRLASVATGTLTRYTFVVGCLF